MAVLVTGSSGMLGRVLSKQLEKSGKVLGVSRRGEDGGIKCDLSDAPSVEKLFEAHPIDLVIHTAAYSDVDGCERDPKLAHAANAEAPRHIAEACGKRGLPWIHVSTDYVFDGRKRTPYKEEDATGPVNIYGVTKWIGEFYAKNSVTPCANVRVSWLFGGPNPKNFVNAIAERIKKENVVSALDDQTDAPTSVKDLSLALEKMVSHLKKLPKGTRWNETFHVCNGGGTTRLEMTEAIRDFMGKKSVRVEKGDASKITGRVAIRPAYAVMDNSHFEKTFGMKIRPWRESLREYIESL